MPRRLNPLVTNNFYHIYNKGINGTETFLNSENYNRFIDLVNYYRFDKHEIRYSRYNNLTTENKQSYLNSIQKDNNLLVNIHSFSLMPNHYHFLLEQLQDKGIQKFISNLINGYTKYFNAKEDHYGQLFLTQFKAKLVLENEVFLHVCRYIILNPLTAYMLKSFKELKIYPFSCLLDFIGTPRDFITTTKILGNFKTIKSFEDFIADQENYQKELKILENLLNL